MSETGAAEGEGEFFVLAQALGVFKAGPLQGDPSDRALAHAAGVSATTVGDWLRGKRFPQEIDKVLIVVRSVRAVASARGLTRQDSGIACLLDEQRWRRAHQDEARERARVVSAGVRRAQAAVALAEPAAGRLLAEISDPFALEVHRPMEPDGPHEDLPLLPVYVPREHDERLEQVVAAAGAGSSAIVVLVGGSSTGKTRACWEALRLLRSQKPEWRIWHPIDPSRPDAALRELPAIGRRTVVWLNEAQFYLDVADGGVGERVSAGLRELLRDPARSPVLVLATLWPSFWDGLTARPASGADPHAQARELLAGQDMTVPAAFTRPQLQQLREAGDARLVQAAQGAQDGQVIQYLAGAPELLARYRNAPPAARALIHAAMDARRLGMRPALPHAFLEAAAPGYLTDAEWDQLAEDWLEQALAYTSAPCKGVGGPLTRIRPRPARTAGSPSRGSAGPAYRLADYLDQYGRRTRHDHIPPTAFWAAADTCADPGDLRALGDAAHSRGLYRDAAQLDKHAAARGDPAAAANLVRLMHRLHTADQRPADWAAAHAALDDPAAVARLLDDLRAVGTGGQFTTLADRAAAHAALDDPYAVAVLLHELRAEAGDQFTTLAGRAAAHAPLDNPVAVARLLTELRAAKASDQIITLLNRDPAGQAALDDSDDLAARPTEETGDQITTLADRVAHAPPAHLHLYVIAWHLGALGVAEAGDQITTLAGRTVAHAPLDDPAAVAELLGALREAEAGDQVATLLKRDPAGHVTLDDPAAVAELLGALREAEAGDQVATLLKRDPAGHVTLDDPAAVAELLGALREAEAGDQVATLLKRDPAGHVTLDDPAAVAELLGALREAEAGDQVATLAGRAADHVALDDLATIAALLDELRAVGAGDWFTTLAGRAAAHAPLDDLYAVARLLDELRAVGAGDWFTTLAGRAAAHAPLDNPYAVATLLDALETAKAGDWFTTLAGRAAAHAPLDHPAAITRLLGALRAAEAGDQATVLINRLPGAGLFKLFCELEGHQDRFRFGRETDGHPAQQWSWEDLD